MQRVETPVVASSVDGIAEYKMLPRVDEEQNHYISCIEIKTATSDVSQQSLERALRTYGPFFLLQGYKGE